MIVLYLLFMLQDKSMTLLNVCVKLCASTRERVLRFLDLIFEYFANATILVSGSDYYLSDDS